MRFQDLIGQQDLAAHLVDTEKRGRTAHAQLFVAAEGRGGLPLALAYAQYLMCENRLPQDACGICPACKKMDKLQHIDFHFSFPVIGTGKTSDDFLKEWREALRENPYLRLNEWLQKMGAENQQPNLNKQECVLITKKLSFTKSEGRYKVLILWLPEFLDKEGNRLLKLIEEPEPDTVFILVTEQAEKILNTILSRCQPVKFPPIAEAALERALVQHGAAANLAPRLARQAEGSWTRALQLLHADQNELADMWLSWLQACRKPQYAAAIYQWTEKALGECKWGRKDLLQWMQYGLFFLREMVNAKVLNQIPALNAEELALSQSLKLGLERYNRLSQALDEHAYYVERNANPKLLLWDLGHFFAKTLR